MSPTEEIEALKARVAELDGALSDLLGHIHSCPTMSGELTGISIRLYTGGKSASDAIRWASYVLSETGAGRWLTTHDAETRAKAIEEVAQFLIDEDWDHAQAYADGIRAFGARP